MKQVPEVICLGMSVADILVKGLSNLNMEGQTSFVDKISVYPGGDALNESITLSALGHNVALLTLVGDDEFGHMLVQRCSESGVITDGIVLSKDYATSTSIVLIGEDGERSFLSQRDSASANYSISDINTDYLVGVKVLSIGSIFSSQRLDDTGLTTVLKRAKSTGAVTIADMVLDRPECSLEDIKTALPYLDYIVPSYDEAAHFSGQTDLDKISSVFLQYGVRCVVIKLGENGVYARRDNEKYHIPTFATKVVDTTGAGDNFMAGFISGLLRNGPLKECLRFGSGTAAISLSKIGASGAIKSVDQVLELINGI